MVQGTAPAGCLVPTCTNSISYWKPGLAQERGGACWAEQGTKDFAVSMIQYWISNT